MPSMQVFQSSRHIDYDLAVHRPGMKEPYSRYSPMNYTQVPNQHGNQYVQLQTEY